MTEQTDLELTAMLDGKLRWGRVQEIMHAPRDQQRFDKVLAIQQSRVAFKEKILLQVGLALYIVEAGEQKLVKCRCGHTFCDFRVNWKLFSNVFVRDTQEACDEIYPDLHRIDPDLVQIREFYCPTCATMLEVECLTRGMPAEFEFLPDLASFYGEWLQRPLENPPEYWDRTSDVLAEWASESA